MVTINLLGPPTVRDDRGGVRAPRGRKAWALLAYLLLNERPVGRSHLAELLFGEAGDPLGALRWTLAELRRALGVPGAFAGDPVSPRLGPQVAVDLETITATGGDAAPLLRLGGELLEGMQLAAHPEYESWLLVERHRIAALLEARLRTAAVALLAEGRAREAVSYAARAVAGNPLEEGNHELLVRSLAMAGDRDAARRQALVCEDLLRRELGIEVSAAVREAATAGAVVPAGRPGGGRAAASSRLDAGEAALVAGAVEAGLASLRQAAEEAARCGDAALEGRARAALGSALVHAVRGRDEEGSVMLHQAAALATRAGDRATAVTAYRELGFVEVQAGRRATADRWLARAAGLAETDDECATVLAVRGMNASDRGDYPAAFAYLAESVERSVSCGNRLQEGWSLSIAARAHLLRGEYSQAGAALARSLEAVREQRWFAFLPWPQSLQAELDLRLGRVDEAADALERAWAMACQLGDPCWEAMSARGMSLLHAHKGDHTAAAGWLAEADTRITRVSDRYRWVHAHVLDTAVGALLGRGDEARARPLAADLQQLAARCEMREFVVRAHLHHGLLGDTAALAAARRLATEIDNPALVRMVEDPGRR
ncbi:hypothetical protein BJF78_05125 [Pseudonocardia sp. CNS-139]|nr:hypothetical protein BJF78_05125 [Pseudonocardia sp. CNS-139]